MTTMADVKNPNKVVIDWMREIMDAKQWNGSELARRAGVAESTILRLINNKDYHFMPSLKTLQKVASAARWPIPTAVAEARGVSDLRGGPNPGTGHAPAHRAGDEPLSARYPGAYKRNRTETVRLRYVSMLPESLHPALESEIEVPRPPQLSSDVTAFAFYLPDNSLEPFFHKGTLMYATKRRDPAPNDIVLMTDQEGKSRVRKLLDIDERGLSVGSGNDADIVSFDDVKDIAIVAGLMTV